MSGYWQSSMFSSDSLSPPPFLCTPDIDILPNASNQISCDQMAWWTLPCPARRRTAQPYPETPISPYVSHSPARGPRGLTNWERGWRREEASSGLQTRPARRRERARILIFGGNKWRETTRVHQALTPSWAASQTLVQLRVNALPQPGILCLWDTSRTELWSISSPSEIIDISGRFMVLHEAACITFVQCRPNVEDVVQMLYNFWCLLGTTRSSRVTSPWISIHQEPGSHREKRTSYWIPSPSYRVSPLSDLGVSLRLRLRLKVKGKLIQDRSMNSYYGSKWMYSEDSGFVII